MSKITESLPYNEAKTLYYSPYGLLIRYGHATLQIQDLNPEQEIEWRMSRLELFKFAALCISAAIFGA